MIDSLVAAPDRNTGRFEYFDGVIYVPLKVPETLFVNDFSLSHGLREMNYAHQLNALFDEFVLIDCGAYYGQVSMRISKLCPGLSEVLLIDPNPDNCEYARANLELTGVPFKVVNAAVSDYAGTATLHFPDGHNVPDSAHIEHGEQGDVRVLCLDDLLDELDIDLAGRNLALKVDVEGEEKAAVYGAERIIRTAARVCYFLELHPGVLKRIGQTAESLLQSVSRIRNTQWYLADRPDIKLMSNTPIFEQIGAERICDVIGVTVG